MKHHLACIAFLACVLAAGYAGAERLRDMSLSPEETWEESQKSSSGKSTPPLGGTSPQENHWKKPSFLPYDGMRGEPGNSFMEGYCDPNFRPLVANPDYLDCLEHQKQEICDMFWNLPEDAQQALDDTLGCYNAGNEEDTQPMRRDISCEINDRQRLELLKKYWEEQSVMYALLFVPDLVTNGANECLR